MLTTKEFAEASGVPYGTLRRWRSKYRGTDEGRQGVLIPVVVGSKGKPSLYAESQLDRARRLHNPNYGLQSLFEEMNDMTDEIANALEVDAKAAADEVFDNGENANPIDADNTHAAQDGAHATIDSDDAEPVTLKQFFAWCTLVGKIRDGQLDAVNRLSRELQAAGIVTDRNQLIELAKTCRHNYNEFRVWLSQLNIDFTDDNGELQRLVVHEDGNAYFEGVVDSVLVTLTVDEEFKSLIPPLSDDERRQLEANILRDGIRDPLVVWQGHGIIVDGHNRYSIATKHRLPFKTREIAFTDRDAVKLWIVQNQFGRRNVNRFSRGELALKLEPSITAKAKANQVRKSADFVLSTLTEQTPIDTRTELAKIAGVSTGTMAKIKYLVEAASDEVKVALRADELTINRAFAAVKAGAVTVEDVLNFKPDRKTESPTPTTPAREVDSSPVEVQDEPPHARDNEPTVDSVDNDGVNGEVVGGEVKRICRCKVAAFDVIGDDDQCDDTPAQIVNARDDVQDSSGDATRNEINALIDRVVELILDADAAALTVTKAGLAGIVAALEKNRPPLKPTGKD